MTPDTSRKPEWISLRQAACCTVTGEPPVFNAYFNNVGYPDLMDHKAETTQLIDAGSLGKISGRGRYARISVGTPEIEERHLRRNLGLEQRLRYKSGYILGWSVSDNITELAPEMWQRHGCIFEQDTLIQWDWADWNDRRIPKQNPQPGEGDYAKHQMEELVCVTDVEIDVRSFMLWQDSLGANKLPHNVRNAGAKLKADYKHIKKLASKAIDDGLTWQNQDMFFDYIKGVLCNGDLASDQSTLFKHWRSDLEFWQRVKAATKNRKQG